MDIICRRFLAQGTAQLFSQGFIPGVGHGGSGGEAGGGHRGVQAQMVPRTRLLAQTVGAVGQENVGDSLFAAVPGGLGAPALQKRSLFLQRQFLNIRINTHDDLSFADNSVQTRCQG